MAELALIAADALAALATRVFARSGVPVDAATPWADALVWANLRGIDGHGVVRIPRYVELIGRGEINPGFALATLRRSPSTILLDADRAPGPVAMTRAMAEAMTLARAQGIGLCIARGITHAGAVGQFVEHAASDGLAAIMLTASGPMMTYPGTRGPAVSTNPVAIAFPTAGGAPLLFDMATSQVALGKVLAAKARGDAIPLDWGVDAAGDPTDRPERVETLLPLGGAKGAGLSLMIECLVSLIAGNPVLAPRLAGEGATNMNGLAIAIDPAAFGDPAAIAHSAASLVQVLSQQPAAAGVTIRMPGTRGRAEAARRAEMGIPLPPALLATLNELAGTHS